MIKLKKQQLAFMDIYQLWSNRDQAFQIVTNEENIIFSQQSDKGLLITEIPFTEIIDFEEEDNIKYNFDTDIFVSLIKSLVDNTEITITEKGIEFLGSKYDIKNYDILFENVTTYLDQVKNCDCEIIHLKDIDKFQYVKNSIGGEGLNTVSYQSNHFVTSDRINYTSFVKTSFEHEKDFYFSSDLFILFNIMNIKEKDIFVFIKEIRSFDKKNNEIVDYEGFYSCKIDNTYVLIMYKKYILPNMLDEEISKVYNHKVYFEVKKQDLQTVLNRMSIVARTNKDSRIYLEIGKDILTIKNIDSQFASENIPATIGVGIEDIVIPISVNFLFKIINQLNGNIIRCYCTSDIDEFLAMKIEDENQVNFYALNLLEG
jgi:hypothetical protein